MKKKILTGLFLCLVVLGHAGISGTGDTTRRLPTYRVGIFAPIYLDSVFSGNTARFKQGLPKFLLPGLEFIQGAQVALDSMTAYDENIQAIIFDSKANFRSISSLIASKSLDSLDLIIGSVKDIDYKQLADFAQHKNIPFISATYPNDGGISSNPYTVIVNPTLRSHCEAIYGYLLENHGTDKIFLCRQRGSQEDKIAMYFKQINEQDGKPLLNIQTISFDSSMNSDFLQKRLDSNRQSVIIGASLDERFAVNLATACYDIQNHYPMTLIGMPNWDGFKEFLNKDNLPGLPLYYTSPYFNSKWDAYSKILMNAYSKKYKSKPSDMAFKGFETVYLFIKLLSKHPKDLMNNLNDNTFRVFSDYNFRPVKLRKENTFPDYYENKHLYFIRIQNGVASKAWQ